MNAPAMHEVIAWCAAVLMLGALLCVQVAKGHEMNPELRALFLGTVAVMVARGTRGAGEPPGPSALVSGTHPTLPAPR